MRERESDGGRTSKGGRESEGERESEQDRARKRHTHTLTHMYLVSSSNDLSCRSYRRHASFDECSSNVISY